MNDKITSEDLKKVIEQLKAATPPPTFITKSYAAAIKEHLGYVPDYLTVIDDQYLPKEIKAITIKEQSFYKPFYKNRRV